MAYGVRVLRDHETNNSIFKFESRPFDHETTQNFKLEIYEISLVCVPSQSDDPYLNSTFELF